MLTLEFTSLSDFSKLLEYSGHYGGPSNIYEFYMHWRVRLFGTIKTKRFKIKINNKSNYFNEIIIRCDITFYNSLDEFLFYVEYSEFVK